MILFLLYTISHVPPTIIQHSFVVVIALDQSGAGSRFPSGQPDKLLTSPLHDKLVVAVAPSC